MSENTHYMMATKATHTLGDLSSKEPSLCAIQSEDEENYIGNWVTGFGFFNVKFPKETTRELTDEEKEEHHGMQISVGSGPASIIYTKDQTGETPKDSPIITLPDDGVRKEQLQDKLKEYRERAYPYRPPSAQMGNVCKIIVLEKLLEDGQVITWDLFNEMADTYGSGFNLNDFNTACAIIDDYCKTGGANSGGGTSLRTPEPQYS